MQNLELRPEVICEIGSIEIKFIYLGSVSSLVEIGSVWPLPQIWFNA